MPKGPLNGPRPGSESTVLLVIREIPVPTKDPEASFPMKVIRATDTEQAIIDDIASRTGFQSRDLSVDKSTSFQRGLGQTDVWNIRAVVSGMSPHEVSNDIDELVDAGYSFDSVDLE